MIYRIILICLLFSLGVFAQDKKDNITVSFNNTPLVTALKTVSEQAGYQVFYMKEWLANIKVSGTYENQPLDTVLSGLLQETLLNHYVSEFALPIPLAIPIFRFTEVHDEPFIIIVFILARKIRNSQLGE